MHSEGLVVSSLPLVERLFQFSTSRQLNRYKLFTSQMVEGILSTHSTLVANIARSLGEVQDLRYTERRLCGLLNSKHLAWEELKERQLEVGAYQVQPNDVIAFDPGDLSKNYAKKMENIYRVHDGSRNDCSNGFEDFSVEAIQWKEGEKFHIPLYQKLMTAKCEDYISQNAQICEAIHAVHAHLGDNRGIWTFDRGHDRGVIFRKAFLLLCKKMRWILRVYANRSVIPEDPKYLPSRTYHTGLIDLAKALPKWESPRRLTFPKKTGEIHLAWHRVKLVMDPNENWLSLVVAHDLRNPEPVFLLTNQSVLTADDAILVFGHYLERWGKEEGYRFCKSFLNTENIRTLNWRATQNLAFLSFLTYAYICLFYQSAPNKIDALCEKKLKHFRPIQEISYRYYRVAQLMRLLIWQKRGFPERAFTMTQVR